MSHLSLSLAVGALSALCLTLVAGPAGARRGRRPPSEAICAKAKEPPPAACYQAGVAYANGDGVREDAKKARKYLERACVAGHGPACGELATLHFEGEGGPEDAPRARRLYPRACFLGAAGACGELAGMWARGDGGPADPARAAFYYRAACSGGQARSCYMAARNLPDVTGPEAKPYLLAACALGREAVCASLGKTPAEAQAAVGGRQGADGAWLPLDPTRWAGPKWGGLAPLEAGCHKGEAAACRGLALADWFGWGPSRDAARGRKAADRACAAKDALGCLLAGRWREEGVGGGAQAAAEAKELLKKACSGGLRVACP